MIRKLIKPVPVQCVQDVISSLFFPHIVCCLQFVVGLELHRRDSESICGAWMSHISGDVRGEVQTGP